MAISTSSLHQAVMILLFTSFLGGCGAAETPSSEPQSKLTTAASSVSVPSSAPIFLELPDSARFASLHLHRDVSTTEQRLLQFDADAFHAYLQAQPADATGFPPLNLGLFSGQDLTITPLRVESRSANEATIFGRLSQDPSSDVVLVVNNDALVGQIRSPQLNEMFEIRPLGEGAHVIRALKSTNGIDGDDTKEAPASAAEQTVGDSLIQLYSPDALPTIDMLVAYTPSARAEQGGESGIQALIQMGIADANRAFEDSGANVRVRLVGTIETRQNESGDLARDLYNLQNQNSGLWSEIHEERRRVHAAQVSVIGAYQGVYSPTGIAYFNAHPDSAFSVLKASSLGNYTLVHELGHNLGLDHSDGFQSYRGHFTTIMSYGAYPRICRFSNPRLLYQGTLLGDSQHDEVDIINRNASRLAGYSRLF